MKAFLSVLLLTVAMTGIARAQQQEQGMLDRIDGNYRKALDAINDDNNPKKHKRKKTDPVLVSPLGGRSFSTEASTGVKAFRTDNFGGIKGAEMKTYETRSFLGLKNPWFGKKVFETDDRTDLAKREAKESREQFKTDSFETKKFAAGAKPDLKDAAAPVPASAQPRPYLVDPMAPGGAARANGGGIDQFTQNLKKDLTIDDVRDLLNRGKGE